MEISMYSTASHRCLDSPIPLFRILVFTLVTEMFGPAAGSVRAEHAVESPDRKVVITFDVGDERGDLIYSVAFEGRPIVSDSRLGLALKDAASLETDFEISKVSTSSHDSTYSPIYGERKTIRDNYNQTAADVPRLQ
jgi:hypothetical protein